MEFLVLIPIIAMVWGWLKTNPSLPPPPDPVYMNNSYEDLANDEYFWGTDGIDASINSSSAEFLTDDSDDEDWGGDVGSNDLMLDPLNSWCSYNIYHHDD